MESIDELEPVKRGIYSGAVGHLSWNGNMDTAIAIRTAAIKDRQLHIQGGAGIVVDSVPELEWKETMNKGRAIFRAVAIAEAGIERLGCAADASTGNPARRNWTRRGRTPGPISALTTPSLSGICPRRKRAIIMPNPLWDASQP